MNPASYSIKGFDHCEFYVGNGEMKTNQMPINFYYNGSYNQMLYRAEESGVYGGLISELSVPLLFFGIKENSNLVF